MLPARAFRGGSYGQHQGCVRALRGGRTGSMGVRLRCGTPLRRIEATAFLGRCSVWTSDPCGNGCEGRRGPRAGPDGQSQQRSCGRSAVRSGSWHLVGELAHRGPGHADRSAASWTARGDPLSARGNGRHGARKPDPSAHREVADGPGGQAGSAWTVQSAPAGLRLFRNSCSYSSSAAGRSRRKRWPRSSRDRL